MKSLILSFLFLFYALNITSCAQEESLVYLAIDSVTVSSFDATPDWAPPHEPQAIIDGDLLTRWSSDYTENQWICLDFGKPKILSKMVIFWEAAYAVDYGILTSFDNENWQILLSLKDQDGGIDEIEFPSVKVRFVKLLGKKRLNPNWGISLWEFLCLGPGSENLEDKPLVSVYPQLANQLGREEIQEAELEIEEPLPSPGILSLDEFQKGVVYTSWSSTELGAEVSDLTLEYLKELGVRHLGIMIVWFQDSIEEGVISPDEKDTPEDKALAHAINKAHSLGMKIMLKPHVDVKEGDWRGDIIPTDAWFTSYKNYLIHYARLASRYNVELFSIGTELVNVTLPNWQSQWDDIIKELREIFPGALTYCANWDEYKTVDFWNKLDFVGIDAYFPLTAKKDPTKEELIAAWQGNMGEVENWLKEKQLDKPVIFSEIGYCSADGTNIQPWSVYSNLPGEFIDQEEQADCLEAMLAACSTYSWFKGFYWWNYFPQERWSPLGYTIRGKRAEEILFDWLKRL